MIKIKYEVLREIVGGRLIEREPQPTLPKPKKPTLPAPSRPHPLFP